MINIKEKIRSLVWYDLITKLKEILGVFNKNIQLLFDRVVKLENTPNSGGILEAPIDGVQYGRQDGSWTEITGGGGNQGLQSVLDIESFATYSDGSFVGLANGNNGDKSFDFISDNGVFNSQYKTMYSQTNSGFNINSSFFDRINFITYATSIDFEPMRLSFSFTNENGISTFLIPNDKGIGDFILATREDTTFQKIIDNGGNYWLDSLDPEALKYFTVGDSPLALDTFAWQGRTNSFSVNNQGFLFGSGINPLDDPMSVPSIQLRGKVPLSPGDRIFDLPNDKNPGEYKLVTEDFLDNFIPLSGTLTGKPLTNDIEISAPGKPMGFVGYNRPSPGIVYSTEYGLQSQSQYMYMVFSANNAGSPSSNFYRRINYSPTGIDLSGFLEINGGIKADTYFGLAYTDNSFIQKKYVDDNTVLKTEFMDALMTSRTTGTASLVLNGIASVYTIVHNLGQIPSIAFANIKESDNFENFKISYDDINITLTYLTPPAAETIQINWIALK